MDQIFCDGSLELRYRLLKIIADFLTSQTQRLEEADEEGVLTMSA